MTLGLLPGVREKIAELRSPVVNRKAFALVPALAGVT